MNPNPTPDAPTSASADSSPQVDTQNAPAAESPGARKNYFELRLRIRYWWLWTAFGLATVMYPIAVIYTAVSKQAYDARGPQAQYQKQWEDTGCTGILKEQAKSDRMEDWATKRRWKHLLQLDDSHLAWNNQYVLEEPSCLGARIRNLVQTSGPWRYDIVDNKTQTIIVSITPGK